MKLERTRIEVGCGTRVDAVVMRPPAADAALVLAHGAGAGMEHPFMTALATALHERRIATLRFQFPYMQAGRKRPDRPPPLVAAVRGAIAEARESFGGLPLFAGGKSMGGRMTSTAAAEAPLDGVRGLVFFGFPLHPAGREGIGRADHLDDVELPMLFLQGTRDKLADPTLIRTVVSRLGSRARLEIVDGADHGFHVLKRSGRTDEEVLDELAAAAAGWMTDVP